MKLALNRLHFPVTTLGHGRRIGVWFQGCRIHCPGCVSHDTWAFGPGQTTLAAVTEQLAPWLAVADGVTISGGEPFDQPAALHALLHWLRPRCAGDILVFSGYAWEQLAPWLAGTEPGSAGVSPANCGAKIRNAPASRPRSQAQFCSMAGLIDLLITDPFDPAAGQTLALRGSDNQRVHLLTPLARARYAGLATARRDATARALDVVFDGDTVWMAGIPAAGDLERLRAALLSAGVHADTSAAPPVRA